MLKKETIEKLAKLAKVEVSALETAINATEEQEVAIAELSTFTTDELATRDSNNKKTSYNEGKVAGLEIAVKESKEKLGLEFEGKDLDSFAKALQKKTLDDAKINPDAKVVELTKSMDILRNNLEAEKQSKLALEGQINSIKNDNNLISMFPSNLSDILSKNEVLGIVKNKYEFVLEDGKMVAKENGQIVKDATTQAPLEAKDVINSYLKERKLIVEGGGGGQQGRGGQGDAGKGGAILKLSELEQKFKDAGKSVQGVEFQAELNAAMQANPNFDLNA